MASYFNPSNERFKKIIRSDIYADKTGLLKFTNQIIGKDGNCIALSHARRFGKSQAADMLEAYYSCGCDSKTLFDGLEISGSDSFAEHLNQYNVIHLDIASCSDGHKNDLMESIRRRLFRDISMTLDIEIPDDADAAETIYDVYLKTVRKFVIIIDEWDCVVRNYSDDPELVHEYLQFLHSLFKSSESQEFLALGYITGILPIKKIENESALNNFREYTMIRSRELTPYFGFTENEVFDLCRKYNMDPESVKEWYNGYLIDGKHMYNPNSVVQAMLNHDLDSYWKNTSAFSTINKYITLNFEGLKNDVLTLLEGGMVQVNTERFQNDLSVINSKDDALTALIHLGYLGYDNERKKAYIPNYEVATAFQAALGTGNWSEIAETISRCDELLWATIDGDAERVAELIELSHDAYTSVLTYNNENSLSCAVTMAYFTAPAYYTVVREFPSGKGFADIALIPRSDSGNKPAMIIELKWDKSADAAVRQIKERRYDGKLAKYGKEIILVGINYDKDSGNKKHECVIEHVIYTK